MWRPLHFRRTTFDLLRRWDRWVIEATCSGYRSNYVRLHMWGSLFALLLHPVILFTLLSSYILMQRDHRICLPCPTRPLVLCEVIRIIIIYIFTRFFHQEFVRFDSRELRRIILCDNLDRLWPLLGHNIALQFLKIFSFCSFSNFRHLAIFALNSMKNLPIYYLFFWQNVS